MTTGDLELQDLFYTEEVENVIEYKERHLQCGYLEFDVHVISHHSLWAHYIYNSALEMSLYMQKNPQIIENKKILELGAGVGIPSLTAVRMNATNVVITDYPDEILLKMLRKNFNKYNSTRVEGLLWGNVLVESYDVILLADLVFNHSEQRKLLITVKSGLSTKGIALVFFTSHRPWLREKDLEFFIIAAEMGFIVEHIVFTSDLSPVFPEDISKDRGQKDYDTRASVDGYQLRIR